MTDNKKNAGHKYPGGLFTITSHSQPERTHVYPISIA